MPDRHEAESARIREVYERRKAAAVRTRYSPFEPGHLLMTQQRSRLMLGALSAHGCSDLSAKRILEVGCGTGAWLRELVSWGARPENMTGVDLLPDRIAEARRLCPPGVALACGDASRLSLPGAAFDLVLQSTVFTSILDGDVRRALASEILRVLRPGGRVLWYDYFWDNPANPDVRGVRAAEIRSLFPACRIDLRRATLAPPLARVLVPRARLLCQFLECFPWLCTHYLGVIQKPDT